MISQAILRELLRYNGLTGVFTWRRRARHHFTRSNQWRNWNARYPGTIAGRVGERGYRQIAVLDHLYAAHRLAWLYVYGNLPVQQIDHINGHRDDNRIANLRDVSNAQNAKNKRLAGWSSTGRIGVTEYRWNGTPKFVARIRVDGRLHHLGYFETIEAASMARASAEQRFGFQGTHGIYPKPKRRLQSRAFAR